MARHRVMKKGLPTLSHPIYASWRLAVALAVVAALFLVADGRALADPGLDPSSVTATIKPGESLDVSKTVHTPAIPPNPDIVFLADTTGSMAGAIMNVQTNAVNVMNTVLAAQPTAHFAVAQYKDFESDDSGICGPEPAPGGFNLDQALTATQASVTAAVNTWAATGGCDTPEAEINAGQHVGRDRRVRHARGGNQRAVPARDGPGCGIPHWFHADHRVVR
jgi:hypothetical protein